MRKSLYIILGIFSIVLGVICFLLFSSFPDNKFFLIIGFFFVLFGIVILINLLIEQSHQIKKHKEENHDLNEKQRIINKFKYLQLNNFNEIIKVFYLKNNTRRIVFAKLNEKEVIARLQMLLFIDERKTHNIIYSGEWYTIAGQDSFYATLDIAMKEFDNELKNGYVECEIPPAYLVRNKEYFAEIKWIKESDGGRKTIPYGYNYCPSIRLNNSDIIEHLNNIFLINTTGIKKYKTMAIIRYAYQDAPDNLHINLEFEVIEGNKVVAIGKIIEEKKYFSD